MWLASIDVYLGRGIVMSRSHDIPLTISRYLPDVSLLEMLTGHALSSLAKRRLFKRRFRFTLGAGFCGAHPVNVPRGMTKRSEISLIARRVAEESAESVHIHCAMDGAEPGIVASLPDENLKIMDSWCSVHHGVISSIVPLWSAASCLPDPKNRDVKAILIREEHAVTALVLQEGKSAELISLAGEMPRADRDHPAIRRWLLASGYSDDDVLRMRFSEISNRQQMHGGARWTDHWERL